MTSPLKVLYIINSLDVGGAEMNLVRLLEAIDPRRFASTVVSLRPADALGSRLRRIGIRTEALEVRNLGTAISKLPKLRRLIREIRPDVIQTSMYHSNLVGVFASRFAPKPALSWSMHASDLDFSTYSPVLKLAFRLGARLARIPNVTVFNSYVSHRWHQLLGFKFGRCRYIPNGVDGAIFRPDPVAHLRLTSQLTLPSNVVLIGAVGRDHPQKDYPNFLRAFAELRRSKPNAHAVMAGLNLDRANRGLVQLAGSLGISGQLHLLGPRSDIQSMLAGLDLFVLSSAFGEACPSVLIEAMSCGVPSVTTDVGDSARIVGGTGKIVPARDAQALAGACLDLLENRGPAASAAARRRIQDRYSLEMMTNGYCDLFEDLVGRRTGMRHSPVTRDSSNRFFQTTAPRLGKIDSEGG